MVKFAIFIKTGGVVINNKGLKLLPGIALIFSTPLSYAATLHSGVYEGLLLAVSSSGDVTGYYSESSEGSVKQTCSFFISGKVTKNDTAVITSWSAPASVLPGHISADSAGVTLTIPNGKNHAGCINVLLPEIDSGLALEATQQTHWQSLVQANSPRVSLSSTPGQDTQRKAWIVKGDVAGVLQTDAEWAQIQYINTAGKVTNGWVHRSDVLPITSPAP